MIFDIQNGMKLNKGRKNIGTYIVYEKQKEKRVRRKEKQKSDNALYKTNV